MKKRTFFLFSLCLIFSSFIHAQTIKGKVIDDATGETLIGANVLVKGTTTGVTTDFNGNYTITVPSGNSVLAVSYVGFANQEVMDWIYEMNEQIGTDEPSDKQIADYIEKTLLQGRVVPGYGHAVLRITDPRFTVQQKFAEKYIAPQNIY